MALAPAWATRRHAVSISDDGADCIEEGESEKNNSAPTAHLTGLVSNLTSPTISPLLRGVSQVNQVRD
jgi:hypothetical protein